MRNNLFSKGWYLSDGGLETTLLFHYGVPLRHFAAFELMNTDDGQQTLRRYYLDYVGVAAQHNLGFVLETPTWRANPDWANILGYSVEDLDKVNRKSVDFLRELKKEMNAATPIVISGCIGPRGDGYVPENMMSAAEAKDYHQPQIASFAAAGADVVTAMTLNYSNEAAGIVLAAKQAGMPVVISYTVETDGALPNGELLGEAINKVDRITDNYPLHYMVNCAHPEHFKTVLEESASWKSRIAGIRANASLQSHQELNESETLDTGDKELLASGYAELRALLPNLHIVGGCCGTDHTHMEVVCDKLF